MSTKKHDQQVEAEAAAAAAGEVRPAEEPQDVESLQKALAEEKEKAGQYLANWQRAQADFVNYKKRTEQEKADTVRFANSVLMETLLPVLDDLDRALGNVDRGSIDTSWIEGIELIYRKLLSTLEGQGLTRIQTEGQDFDPNYHQAVMHEDGEDGKVIEELQKGYTLGDRLVRPAMVKVGKGK